MCSRSWLSFSTSAFSTSVFSTSALRSSGRAHFHRCPCVVVVRALVAVHLADRNLLASQRIEVTIEGAAVLIVKTCMQESIVPFVCFRPTSSVDGQHSAECNQQSKGVGLGKSAGNGIVGAEKLVSLAGRS